MMEAIPYGQAQADYYIIILLLYRPVGDSVRLEPLERCADEGIGGCEVR